MKRILLPLILLLVCRLPSIGQIDKEFWFVAPEIAQSHGDSPIYMRVSTMEDTAQITLRLPADLSFVPIYQKINPYTTFNINLSSFKDQLENNPPNIVLNKGMLLTSDKYVTAYYECANTSNPGIFSLKGKNALGTDFWIVSQNLYSNHDGKESFDIVATEDGTTVWITPSDTIVGHKAGVTFAVMLHKGQTWSARAVYTTAARMLGGSHVSSDKPIAVTWQDDSIITGGWDIVCDQTIPVNILGKEYITIKGFADNSPPGNNDERVFILATQDNTTINVDGSYASTINTGQEYDYGIPSAFNTAYISASAPVYVMHLSGHPGEAGASIIPHDSCTGSRVVGFNRSSTNAFALLILTRATNKDSFYLNGNNSLIPGSAFNTVPGTGGLWVYYRQNNLPQTTVPLGANVLENTMGNFHLGILNNVGASSEYGFFSNFSSLYLGADASICPGDSMELDAGPFMNSYAWYKKVSGSWLLLDTTRYYTVLDTGTYSCLVNGDFCTLSDTINISYYPLASVFIGNDTTLCQGQNITLDPGPYITYLWSTGSTSRWLNTNVAGTYWVQVTNNNGCSAADTVIIAVDSLPQGGHKIAGPDSVCSLQNNVLYSIDSLHFAQSYTWTLPPGVSGNSTTRLILLSFPAGSSSGILKVHGHNTCGDSPDTSLYITVKPRPGKAGSITGSAAVCQGQAGVSYSTPAVTDATGYAWSLPAGAAIVAGAGTTTITVDYGLAAASGPVSVYATNDCGHSDTSFFPVTVNLFPQPAGILTGPATVCQGQSGVVYSVPAITGADSYLWTLPPGASVTAGAGSPSVTVLFDSTGSSGTFTVRGHSNLCGDGLPSSLGVTVNPLPDPAGPITGAAVVCQGQTGVAYSISPLGNTTTYTWTIAPGSAITAGNLTNNIGVDYSTSASSGFITVRGHNAQCGDGRRMSMPVTVNPLPGAAGTITGAGAVCQLTNGVPYSIPTIAFAASYLWTYSGSGAVLHPAANNSTLDFSLAATGGNLQVTGQNGCGNGPSSPLFPVTVHEAPAMSLQICNNIVTRDAKPFILRGGVPYGGNYSGDGVSAGLFNPGLVPSFKDTAIVTYTYTNFWGCANLVSQKIRVFPTQPFTCGGTLTDVRDGQTYPTVKLGTQCWMAANLDFGSGIPEAVVQRDNCVAEKYCYGDVPANCTGDGGLYQWDELMQYENTPLSQGLCPPGWHIPSEPEWNLLFNFYISSGFAGAPLKHTGYSGFNAFLDGACGHQVTWIFSGFATLFWSSTPHTTFKGWAHGMNSYDPSVSVYPAHRHNAFRARCLKD